MQIVITTVGRPLALVLASLLTACANGPAAPSVAPSPTPVSFKEAGGRWVAADFASLPQGGWWRVFDDHVLDDLMARAAASNTDLQAAAARLAQSQAILSGVRSGYFPAVGVQGSASRATYIPGTGGGPGQALGNVSVGAAASWQPDIFDKIGRAAKAARLDARSSAALRDGTVLLVQSEVAQSYFALRALDDERALLRDTVAAYRDTLKLTESRYRSGDVADLDLARVREEVASTESQAFDLDRQRALAEHALAVLLGEMPSTFALAESAWPGEPPVVPPGIPGVVLARRPDVAAAQQAMQAAEARVGVARAAWFPDITLTGNAGYASTDASDLFKWSARAWGVGALLSLPIFDAGRRQAGVDRAGAEWDAAAASYRAQVLAAVQDVEDQLASLRLLDEQKRSTAEAVNAAARATSLTTLRYEHGYVSQLDMLEARRNELGDRRVELHVRAGRYQATVGLIRALGGTWGTHAGEQAPQPAAS